MSLRLCTASISGMQAHLLQVAAGRFPADSIRGARGWSEHDWADAAATLGARGLLTGDPAPLLTKQGRALLTDIETRTDHAAWEGGLAALGEPAVEEVGVVARFLGRRDARIGPAARRQSDGPSDEGVTDPHTRPTPTGAITTFSGGRPAAPASGIPSP